MDESKVVHSPVIASLTPHSATTRFGLIALSTDLTSEGDCFRLMPSEGTAVHVARVANENPTTPENLRKMAPRLTATAALLAPVGPLKAICYSCTSASVEIGDEQVEAAIAAGCPTDAVITPTRAARLAFAALGARRIAILTPYTIETSRPMAEYFANNGLDVLQLQCFGIEDDRDMARVTVDSIVEAACAADHPDAEALFLSCTALPAIGAVAAVERRTGKPVVTSNQATAWAMAALAGMVDRCPPGFGRLFGVVPETLRARAS
ncbi:MAG: ectoine utilization protein EutA [Alphaproteobacteria bacterium]|nr:ectoine utilization protein EutA [Alphaproteobacteria bacterium]